MKLVTLGLLDNKPITEPYTSDIWIYFNSKLDLLQGKNYSSMTQDIYFLITTKTVKKCVVRQYTIKVVMNLIIIIIILTTII